METGLLISSGKRPNRQLEVLAVRWTDFRTNQEWYGNDPGFGNSAVAYESLSEGGHLTSGSFGLSDSAAR